LITTPPVLRVAFGNGRHRRKRRPNRDSHRSNKVTPHSSENGHVEASAVRTPSEEGSHISDWQHFFEEGSGPTSERERQEKGIAMLSSLSREMGGDLPMCPQLGRRFIVRRRSEPEFDFLVKPGLR
jgi:hypothetical protein